MPVVLLLPLVEILTHMRDADAKVAILIRDMLLPLSISARFGSISAAVAVLFGLPVAIVLAGGGRLLRYLFAGLLFVPLFVNLILRVYSVRYMSMGEAPIAKFAEVLGWTGPLLGSELILMAGLAYIYMPFAAIPIAVSLSRVDSTLVEAAVAVGLGRWRVFRAAVAGRLMLGMLSGWLLTFVPAFGDYLVVKALGGGKTFFLAEWIALHVIHANDRSAGATAALVLWLVTAIALGLGVWVDRRGTRKFAA